MKTPFFSTYFAAIVICLTSKVARSYGELLVLRYASDLWYERSHLTCISEDDNSALVWNYSNDVDGVNSDIDFQPKKSRRKNITECAIWESSECMTHWEQNVGWDVVESAEKPTGPVFDYRWEDFKELVFEKKTEEPESQYVRELKGSSSSVVFSVRGSRDVDVVLCEKKNLKGSDCFRIGIGSLAGMKSTIRTCVDGKLKDRDCVDVARVLHRTAVIDEYEWRTFRIEWKSEEQAIKVFKETEAEPFLKGTVSQWHPASHLFVKSNTASRVRFHFYDYLLTENQDAELSTAQFYLKKGTFCVELLVGLCPNCKLKIDLIDSLGQRIIATNTISGDEKFANSDPLFWRSINLVTNSESPFPKHVRLKIKTILTEGMKGRWAVDNFHVCKSNDSLRHSKIEILTYPPWPRVKCQKLSYSQGAIVDYLSESTTDHETSRLLPIVRISKITKNPSNESLGARWFVCDPIGCTCDRGYQGSKCTKGCSAGSYGYNCGTGCGKCSSGSCNGANGYCDGGCSANDRLPPLCKVFDKPIVRNMTDAIARVFYNVERNAVPYIANFVFNVSYYSDVQQLYRDPSKNFLVIPKLVGSTYESNITNLRPDGFYHVYGVASVAIAGSHRITEVKSGFIRLQTFWERCFKVVPEERSLLLNLRQDLQECGAMLQERHYLEYRAKGETIYTTDTLSTFPYTYTGLKPHTEYELIVYTAVDTIILWTGKSQTLQSAPGGVRKLRWSELSDTKVILHWAAPRQKNGIITKYIVSLKRIALLGCKDLGRPTPEQNEISKEVSDTTASFSGLHPYAKYAASVIAHTTRPGPKEELDFQTPESDIPSSVVSNVTFIENKNLLQWDKPTDCTTISGPTNTTRLFFTEVSDLMWDKKILRKSENGSLDMKLVHLIPYTPYKVRVHILRVNTNNVNSVLYQEYNWTTAPTAPPAVTDLAVYEADPERGTIPLRWLPPYPANGELKFYRVSVCKLGSDRILNETEIESQKGIPMCELWENYVCFDDLAIQPDARNAELIIKVYARNYGVEDAGAPMNITFNPKSIYNSKSVPAKPSISPEINQGHGLVTFRWKHPISLIKITGFRVTVKYLHSELWENKNITTSYLPVDYPVTKKRKEYSTELHLLPSTTYNFSIVSKYRNRSSPAVAKEILVANGFGFTGDEKLRVERDGTLIKVKVPVIINATRNTVVSVIVNGLLQCVKNQTGLSFEKKELVVDKYNTSKSTPSNYTVGMNQSNFDNLNCSLKLYETYDIKVVVKDANDTILATIACASISLTFNYLTLVWLAVLPILAILILTFFICRRRLKRGARRKRNAHLHLESTSSTDNLIALFTLKRPKLKSNIAMEDRASRHIYQEPFETGSRVVSVEYFSEYTKKAASSGLLLSQYMMFPRDLMKPCEYGKLPQNMPKNRHKKQIPYDESRVVLPKIPGNPDSDYINASYIQGNRGEKAYIATQGPLPNTVNDFWRMVWHEKVYVICMLANVTENGKTNCEQYWPEVGIKKKYGDVSVEIADLQVSADYAIRSLRVSCQKYKRKITHLHYTAWPERGIPTYSRSLVAYLKRLVDTPTGSGPTVVHCSTGDARTGTFILCDICWRQAVEEKVIDVVGATTRMRDSRANMVGCSQQYLLAHVVITECITATITQIPCDDDFAKRIKGLKNRLPYDIERLNDTVWQERVLYSLVSPQSPTPGDFQRNKSLQELDSVRPDVIYFERFSTPNNEKNNYIGAVSVDGVKTKKQYLASQLPSNSTWSKFWLLIAKQNVELIITLQRSDPNDPSRCDIMSDRATFAPVPGILVETKQARYEEDHFTREQLLLTDTSGEEKRLQPVTVLTCTGWGQGRDGKPPSPAALVSLWRASVKIPRKEGLSLVLCHDGVTGCGLYLALNFLLERMAVERECDVISAVRAVRRFRPEFVKDLEDFEYLYDAAVNYVDCFETYSNFS